MQVFQRRKDGTVDFYRSWSSYKEGFGAVNHEFWLGNDKLHHLTNQKRYTIRIDFVNRYGTPYYGKYDFFRIGNETELYQLTEVGAYNGNAGLQIKDFLTCRNLLLRCIQSSFVARFKTIAASFPLKQPLEG